MAKIKVSRTTTIVEISLGDVRDEDIDTAPDVCDDLIARIEALAEMLGVTEEQAEHLILGN
jgi:hypothetical protein